MFWKIWKKIEIYFRDVRNEIIKYTPVCKGCLVKSSCDLSKPCEKLELDEDKLRDIFTQYRCCPDCGSKKFYEGPSGGMAQNMQCCGCSHWFNMGLPLFVQRIHYTP